MDCGLVLSWSQEKGRTMDPSETFDISNVVPITDCFLENNRYESCLEQQDRDLRRPVRLRHEEDFSASRPRLELGYQKETV